MLRDGIHPRNEIHKGKTNSQREKTSILSWKKIVQRMETYFN